MLLLLLPPLSELSERCFLLTKPPSPTGEATPESVTLAGASWDICKFR